MPDKTNKNDFGGTLDAIVVSDTDNIAVCLHDVEAGTEASVRRGKENFSLTANDPIPRGHKFALHDISKGDKIVKYGEIIGEASENIGTGKHVHVHNVID